MVLKPLRVVGDGTCAARGVLVFQLHYALPRAFQAEWVAIDLYEPVDEVDSALLLLQPLHAELVETSQVASGVIVGEQVYQLRLQVVLGHAFRLLQPIDYLF